MTGLPSVKDLGEREIARRTEAERDDRSTIEHFFVEPAYDHDRSIGRACGTKTALSWKRVTHDSVPRFRGLQWRVTCRRRARSDCGWLGDLSPCRVGVVASATGEMPLGLRSRVPEAFMSLEARALTIRIGERIKALQRDRLDGALTWVKAPRRQGRRQQASQSCQHYDRRDAMGHPNISFKFFTLS